MTEEEKSDLKGKQSKEQLFICAHENYSRCKKSGGMEREKGGAGTERQGGAMDWEKQGQKLG